MIGEIVCVGTELLLGQITNTNARFLAQRLAELGIDVYFQQVVGDNHNRLVAAVELALRRSDLVITCGGLGPTEDDLTKETVCQVLGVQLVPNPEVAERIEGILLRHGSRAIKAAVAKQSLVPEGATVLPNPVGTAPGLFVSKGGKHVALLPGPPPELEPIVRQHLVPLLETWMAGPAGPVEPAGRRSYLFTRTVKVCHIGEPAVEEAVRDLLHSANPTVAPYVSIGETHLRVTAKACDPGQARRLVEDAVVSICRRETLKPYIFGFDDDAIASACGSLLRRKGFSLAIAESLTGGLVGHMVTQVPGSSHYFERGLVVYSNRAKVELLGVDPDLLARRGAVSEEVARAMALGARSRSGTDLGLALTGIAGPDGGTGSKPVGLVYIALAGAGKPEECHRYVFSGDRQLVKQRAAHRALVLLWLRLRD